MAQRDLPGALASCQTALAIMESLTKSDPGNASWQRDLSIRYDDIGEVRQAQGNLPGALASYRANLGIRERLAQSDPGNADWQRDLSLSYLNIGTTYQLMKQPAKAQAALAAGRTIISDYPQWKQFLAAFDEKIAALKN
jgi:hypothetical protein